MFIRALNFVKIKVLHGAALMKLKSRRNRESKCNLNIGAVSW
jgi:hypothetical protein